MAKISELADGGNLLNDDELIVLRAGGNVRATVANLPEVDSSGNMAFADNEKATFGTGNDLEIFHDGSNSRVKDTGTGGLYLQGSSFVSLTNASATETYVYAAENGAVQLKYDNSTKLATTSTGVDVSGTVSSGDITITDTFPVMSLVGTTGGATWNQLVVSDGSYQIRSGTPSRLNISTGGDVSFYEDTGTTPKFFWDSSAESLGIGTSSPAAKLEIDGGTGSATSGGTLVVRQKGDTSADGIAITSSDSVSHRIWKDASGNLNIGSSSFPSSFVQDFNGNVGIGTDSPDAKLEVAGSTNDTLFNLTGAGTNFELRATSGNGATANSSVYRLALDYLDGTYTNGFIDFYRGSSGNDGYLAFGSTGAEAMRIDSDGNVGIGTSSPTAFIHAEGTGVGTETYAKFSTGPAAGDQILSVKSSSARNHMALQVNAGGGAVDDLALNPDGGNVGIGTISPSAKGHIAYTTAATANKTYGLIINGDDSGTVGESSSIFLSGLNATTRGASIAAEIQSSSNDHDLIFATSAPSAAPTEAMRIDSSGNLLVGTTSPNLYNDTSGSGIALHANGRLDVLRTDAATAIFNRTGTDGEVVIFHKDGTSVGSIGTNVSRFYIHGSYGSGSGLRFDNASIRPATSTGTSSDATTDLGASAARFKDLYLSGDVRMADSSAIYDQSRNHSRFTFSTHNYYTTSTSGEHRFIQNGGSERMRIDSSGNLLVGKTAALSLTTAGHELHEDGLLVSTRDSDVVGILNRETNDGTILQFRKDNATVGSIGTSNSRLHIGNGDVGLLIAGDLDNITPWNSTTGASRDAAVDLGNSGVRFKDLYLSGGVHLGGTAAANKLDDYEEGAWSPAAQSYEGTMTVNSATYTKIGNIVTARCDLSFDATVDASGVNIGGLPFNHTGANKGNGGFCTKDTSGTTEYVTGEGSASIILYNDSYGNVTYTDLVSGSVAFVYIYETTS